MKLIRRLALMFKRDERGATAIEYGLIAALVALAAAATLPDVGNNLRSLFTTVADKVSTTTTTTP